LSASVLNRIPLVRQAKRLAGNIRQQRALAKLDHTHRLTPLLLTANGRSGTTYLMQLMSQHPAVSIFDHYPYEHNQAAYFVNLYRTLNHEPDGQLREQSYAHLVARHEGWLSANPFLSSSNEAAAWYRSEYRDGAANFTRDMSSAYYQHLAIMAGKAQAHYFAECIIPSLDLANYFKQLWPDCREILLVRDMRDLLCSVLAFNRQRGHASFGREIVESDADYVDYVLSQAAADMLRAWQQRGESMHLLRYEELVSDTPSTLDRLFDHLGIENSAALRSQIITSCVSTQGHRTSAAASGSIGRWRSELDDSMQERCNRVFSDYLRTFGYD
jgi:hypothetical protein